MLHALAVHVDAVEAAEVADPETVCAKLERAVKARDVVRIEPDVRRRRAAERDDRLGELERRRRAAFAGEDHAKKGKRFVRGGDGTGLRVAGLHGKFLLGVPGQSIKRAAMRHMDRTRDFGAV